ncbi:MAG TPA: phosphoribosylanthranilate isomerase [Bryobacteraceae bacterium]|nr:phosphoribosylanthranilate isomerase [Bryobacteraceae bacterium]
MIVKICGITNENDAQVALEAGANALGINFYPKSPRYVTLEQARRVTRLPGDHLRVGIFVNAEPDELLRVAVEAGLDVVQVHGVFRPTRLRMWRALSAGKPAPADDEGVEAYLLDTPGTDFGGSGRSFDWSLAAAFPRRKIVAGGLDEWNVAAAIEASAPWGVDACSRLESSPGIKDAHRMRAFIHAARAASARKTLQEAYL